MAIEIVAIIVVLALVTWMVLGIKVVHQWVSGFAPAKYLQRTSLLMKARLFHSGSNIHPAKPSMTQVN